MLRISEATPVATENNFATAFYGGYATSMILLKII
jgi:hypothetical protein